MKKTILWCFVSFFFFSSYSWAQRLTEQDYSELSLLFAEDAQIRKNTKISYKEYQTKRQQLSFSHSGVLTLSRSENSNTNIKKVLVVVNASIYNQLANKIERYACDINFVYGCEVIMETVSGGNHVDIKNLILANQTNLDGVIFIGDISAAWFEISNDHNKYGYDSWACDLYYMDLNGIWADVDNNEIFDSHTGSVQPEIFVAKNKIIVNDYVIPSGKHVVFNAKEAVLNPGFECQAGGSFEIINEGCMSNYP